MVAAAIGGSALLGFGGSLLQSSAASDAANAQVQSAQNASDVQRQMFNITQGNFAPYRTVGTQALAELSDLTGAVPGGNPLTAPLSRPITMDQATLEATPGYQFTLGQGLKAVQNSATSRGLGISGAALRGGADYATGLASQTFQQQFQNALANRSLALTPLLSLTQLGANAAAQQGAIGTTVGGQIGSNIIGAGNAQAAGSIGSANAIAGGLSGVGNNALSFLTLNALTRGQGGLFGDTSQNPYPF